MKTATLLDLLNADAKGLYQQWCEALRLLKTTTDPTVRRMWEEDIKELHAKAKTLRETNKLSGMSLSMMNLVLTRSADQWITVERSRGSIVS